MPGCENIVCQNIVLNLPFGRLRYDHANTKGGDFALIGAPAAAALVISVQCVIDNRHRSLTSMLFICVGWGGA